MALAEIIDLEERRRARRVSAPVAVEPTPVWCFVWMPVYYWYMS